MKRSGERILTTHVGSLPRPPDLLDMVQAKEQRKPVDEKAHAAKLRASVKDVVRKQIELGIDIIDDGEFGKPSFVSYVNERLGGFKLDTEVPRQSPWAASREARSFPEFYGDGHVAARQNHMVCTAPVTYRGMAQLQVDIANLRAALNGAKPAEVFMPAISPTSAADWQRNGYYKSEEEYLFAIADALREEYEAIVKAGFLLQVNVGAYQFEAANPRHEHEWVVWRSVKLPPGKVLIPGVISHATNIVEHPELVAQRIVRLANIVGRENLMGGTDCGFAQSPFAQRVHPTIMWAKLRSLAEGAKIATDELWGRRSAA